jgi:hypothetical protein
MKRLFTIGVLLLVLGIFLVPTALAASGQPPVGDCPRGFEAMGFHQHEMEHHDHHIGLEIDLNQNQMICVRHLSGGLHVHVDDVIRTR